MFGISNILLEIHNMKQSRFIQILLFLAGSFVLGIAAYQAMGGELDRLEWIIVGLTLGGVLIALVVGLRRLKDERRGIPAEDEMTQSVKQKAASIAFHGSFYSWSALMLVTMDRQLAGYKLIAVGLMLTVLIYFGAWWNESRKGR